MTAAFCINTTDNRQRTLGITFLFINKITLLHYLIIHCYWSQIAVSVLKVNARNLELVAHIALGIGAASFASDLGTRFGDGDEI